MPPTPNPSRNYAWNGVLAYPLMPAAGETVNGERIIVPRAAETMVIYLPALAGVATTVELQTLSPSIAADGTETWLPISVLTHDAAGVADTTYEIDALAESTHVVLYKSQFGTGILRLVASADQSAAPVRIPVIFGF